MNFKDWAARWNIPPEAIAELAGLDSQPVNVKRGKSEAAVQQEARLEYSRRGGRLWRNNRGAAVDAKTERHIRYGLANDSKQLNDRIKSSDLIGITPRIMTEADVGRLVGIFTSYEVKPPGWRYTATDREVAQAAWIALIVSMGGLGRFITSPEDLY